MEGPRCPAESDRPRRAPDKAHRHLLRLNSTTALRAYQRPRKVGAESSSSYTVTGKGAITSSSRAPREPCPATSSYFSRCSRSRAKRVLTSRLSDRSGKADSHLSTKQTSNPGMTPSCGEEKLPSSGAHRRGDRAGVHAEPGPRPFFSSTPSTVCSRRLCSERHCACSLHGADREERDLPQVLSLIT